MSSFCQDLQKAVQNQDLDIHWKNNAAFLSLAYGVPTLALNIRVVSMLFLNRKREEFSSQFYTLFIIATILVIETGNPNFNPSKVDFTTPPPGN